MCGDVFFEDTVCDTIIYGNNVCDGIIIFLSDAMCDSALSHS